jgi:anti-sigma-K factor RskA
MRLLISFLARAAVATPLLVAAQFTSVAAQTSGAAGPAGTGAYASVPFWVWIVVAAVIILIILLVVAFSRRRRKQAVIKSRMG